MIKKIVYLHGLESKAGGPKVDFLATKGLVYAPEINFKTSSSVPKIMVLL